MPTVFHCLSGEEFYSNFALKNKSGKPPSLTLRHDDRPGNFPDTRNRKCELSLTSLKNDGKKRIFFPFLRGQFTRQVIILPINRGFNFSRKRETRI